MCPVKLEIHKYGHADDLIEFMQGQKFNKLQNTFNKDAMTNVAERKKTNKKIYFVSKKNNKC